jgi:uncharacterized protein
MRSYPIIDTHTHTFPTREIGRQAIQMLPHQGSSGVIEDLLPDLAAAGFARAVMLNFTPTGEMREDNLAREGKTTAPAKWGVLEEQVRQTIAGRVQRRNAWTMKMARENPTLIPFIGVDPRMGEEGMLQEVDACVRGGARGIKFHCSTQRSYPTDQGLWAVYKRAEELGIAVVFHSGWHPLGCHLSDYARPARFAGIAKSFPKLNVVLAHIGLGWQEEAVELAKAYRNVYFDSALVITGTWNPPPLADDEIVNLLKQVGIDRVMFASDWPLCVPLKERQRAESLPMTDAERQLLFYENAQRILRI